MSSRNAARALTARQREALQRMRGQRQLPPGLVIPGWDEAMNGAGLTREQVDMMFAILTAMPRAHEPVEPGTYAHEGAVYKVRRNRAGTNVYASRQEGDRWEYAPGVIFDLRPEERVSA